MSRRALWVLLVVAQPLAAQDHSHAGSAAADENAQHSHTAPAMNDVPTDSERAHIPPEPPSHPMPDMSEADMIELMQMEDDAPIGLVQADRLEWRARDGDDEYAWEAQAWYGTDYDKLWFESEGEHADETDARAELLWDRIVSPWWSVQLGVRQDFGDGPSRTWAAIGLQGLAPYWFEIDAAVYVGEQGRTALRLSSEYQLLITQRWVLQPEAEIELYGKDDARNRIGSGLAAASVGVRLRYELRREVAPYVGVLWSRKFGDTADFVRAEGDDAEELRVLAGLRVWF